MKSGTLVNFTSMLTPISKQETVKLQLQIILPSKPVEMNACNIITQFTWLEVMVSMGHSLDTTIKCPNTRGGDKWGVS